MLTTIAHHWPLVLAAWCVVPVVVAVLFGRAARLNQPGPTPTPEQQRAIDTAIQAARAGERGAA